MMSGKPEDGEPGSAPPPRRRGRPRGYDPDRAIGAVTASFWDAGYAATSLDDLSLATGMNRPSLYHAFGDKRALYLETLDRYRALGRATAARALVYDQPVRTAFANAYRDALAIYLDGGQGQRGCFLIGTAVAEAVRDPGIRAILAAGLAELEAAFAARLRAAGDQGELPAGAVPEALAMVASAILHSLAIRARAGASRAELDVMIDTGLDLICGRSDPGI